MTRRIMNFLAFQIGWFACVLGAAHGLPSLGPAMVGVWIVAHVASSRSPRTEVCVILAAGLLGYVADSVLVLSGWVGFEEPAVLGWPTTIWMVALWMNLATTLGESLSFLRGRFATGLVLGAVAGPLAYWAGERLGAIYLAPPRTAALAAVAVEWSLALPALLALERLASRNSRERARTPTQPERAES